MRKRTGWQNLPGITILNLFILESQGERRDRHANKVVADADTKTQGDAQKGAKAQGGQQGRDWEVNSDRTGKVTALDAFHGCEV